MTDLTPFTSRVWEAAEEACTELMGEFPCEYDRDCTHLCLSPEAGCLKGVRFTIGALREARRLLEDAEDAEGAGACSVLLGRFGAAAAGREHVLGGGKRCWCKAGA